RSWGEDRRRARRTRARGTARTRDVPRAQQRCASSRTWWLSSLPMTCGAVGRGLEVVLLCELLAELDGVFAVRLGPGHVRDLLRWTEVLVRLTMTIEAPAHAERRELVDLGLLIDAPVTGHASHAAGHVGAVVEVDVVGKVVDLLPLHRGARLPALADRLELRA